MSRIFVYLAVCRQLSLFKCRIDFRRKFWYPERKKHFDLACKKTISALARTQDMPSRGTMRACGSTIRLILRWLASWRWRATTCMKTVLFTPSPTMGRGYCTRKLAGRSRLRQFRDEIKTGPQATRPADLYKLDGAGGVSTSRDKKKSSDLTAEAFFFVVRIAGA